MKGEVAGLLDAEDDVSDDSLDLVSTFSFFSSRLIVGGVRELLRLVGVDDDRLSREMMSERDKTSLSLPS